GFDTECVQNLLLLLGKVVEHKVTEVTVDFVEQCVLVFFVTEPRPPVHPRPYRKKAGCCIKENQNL
ncbi:hypothetical protein, partial [Faecalibacterium prausnitzii]